MDDYADQYRRRRRLDAPGDAASGAPTKRAAVEQGLRLLVDVRGQGAIRRLRGKVKWTGNLDESRLGRAARE